MEKQPGPAGKSARQRAPADAESQLISEPEEAVEARPATATAPADTEAPPMPLSKQATLPPGKETTHLDTTAPPAASTPQGPASAAVDPLLQSTAVQTGPPQQSSEATTQKVSALGDFKLARKLGAGGMGAVFMARQISLDRDAAVKVLAKHLASDPKFVERFQREARIMARLDHANIVRCYGVGEAYGFHYCAMEFIDGGSMQSWLRKLGKLAVGDALNVVIACARGLEHAHEQGVIHRDIKPDNILVTKKGVVKVADMGLAKAHGENVTLTRTGMGAGTPVYMSPEQARDAKHVDHRSDLYSLGCMLYAFLTGQPPFRGETYVEILEAKETGKFPPARRTNPDIPERLDLIIDKLVDKRLEVRYQGCAELLKDLEGLGLANATLSFLEAAVPVQGSAARSAKPHAGLPGPHFPAEAHAATPEPRLSPWEADAGNTWFVSSRSHDGRLMRHRMTTDQLRDLIHDDRFDLHTEISHTLEGGYRPIGTYAEFEGVLRARVIKVQANRKTAKLRDFYQNIDQQEKSRQRRRWFGNMFRGAVGYAGFLVYLAIILGVIFLGYLAVKYGFHWLSTKIVGD
jgi:serine/threonine protein kinase